MIWRVLILESRLSSFSSSPYNFSSRDCLLLSGSCSFNLTWILLARTTTSFIFSIFSTCLPSKIAINCVVYKYKISKIPSCPTLFSEVFLHFQGIKLVIFVQYILQVATTTRGPHWHQLRDNTSPKHSLVNHVSVAHIFHKKSKSSVYCPEIAKILYVKQQWRFHVWNVSFLLTICRLSMIHGPHCLMGKHQKEVLFRSMSI